MGHKSLKSFSPLFLPGVRMFPPQEHSTKSAFPRPVAKPSQLVSSANSRPKLQASLCWMESWHFCAYCWGRVSCAIQRCAPFPFDKADWLLSFLFWQVVYHGQLPSYKWYCWTLRKIWYFICNLTYPSSNPHNTMQRRVENTWKCIVLNYRRAILILGNPHFYNGQ